MQRILKDWLRTIHDAQAKVEEQAGDVAAQPGGVGARDPHFPVGVLITADCGAERAAQHS